MGFFSKLAKLDPLAGRVIKDTAKVTSAVAKVSGGKDIAANVLAKDVNKVARATGAIKPAKTASGKIGAAPAPKPVAKKPAPKPAAKPKPVASDPGFIKTPRVTPKPVASDPGFIKTPRVTPKPVAKPKPMPAARPVIKPTIASASVSRAPGPAASKPGFGTVAHMQSLRGKTGSR